MTSSLAVFLAALAVTLPAPAAGHVPTSVPTPVCNPSWGTITIPICL
jgi:hypothetical protein